MTNKKGVGLLTFLAVFLFLLVLILSFFLYRYRIPRLESFHYYLTQTDSLQRDGRVRQAKEALEKSSSFARGTGEWLRIIKRAYLISSESDDWNVYRKYTERAVKLYRGNDEFWMYYLTALLWTGDYDRLFKYRYRISEENYPTVSAEIRLTEESLEIDSELPPYQGVMQRLEQERDAEFYGLVGDISGIDDLKADSLMLWMALGEKEKAVERASTLGDVQPYLQLLGLLYWDRGDVQTAVDFLNRQDELDRKNHNRRWTLNNILGDGYFLLGDWEKSEYHYLTSLEIRGDDNWRPLVNRAMIYEKARIWKEASRIILDTLNEYGDEREVILYFLDNWLETYPVRAERVVNTYLNNHPDDVEVMLERFSSFPEELTPEAYRAFIWKLFNENSADEKVTRYLLWYMAVSGDFESMYIIMDRHEKVLGYRPDWYDLYEGLILALKKPQKYEESEQTLSDYYDKTHDWFGAWNLAVLLDHQGKSDEADGMRKKAVDN